MREEGQAVLKVGEEDSQGQNDEPSQNKNKHERRHGEKMSRHGEKMSKGTTTGMQAR